MQPTLRKNRGQLRSVRDGFCAKSSRFLIATVFILAWGLAACICLFWPAPTQAAMAAENLASGRPYTWSAPPSYPACTDAGDRTDLTDGQSAGSRWDLKSTVGWRNLRGSVELEIDLGQVEQVTGVSFATAWGTAGVTSPKSIVVTLSSDGNSFTWGDELICSTSGRLPPAYGTPVSFRYRSSRLNHLARYVRFEVVPSGKFLFCDEIEVISSRNITPAQRPVTPSFLSAETTSAVRLANLGSWTRLRRDVETVTGFVRSAPLDKRVSALARGVLLSVADDMNHLHLSAETVRDFRAIVPLNDLHEAVFRVHAHVLASRNVPALHVWHSAPYGLISPFEDPRDGEPNLQVEMMPGEWRAEVLNYTNTTQSQADLSIQIDGLPSGTNPDYIRVFQVEYVDTSSGHVSATALLPLQPDKGVYRSIVFAGMTRQLWFSFRPTSTPPGSYSGEVKWQSGDHTGSVPLRMVLAPVRFPRSVDCSLSMWDYAFDRRFDITARTQAAAVYDLSEHLVDAPWCVTPTTPVPTAEHFDRSGNLVQPIDYSRWDAFVDTWPGARFYLAFAGLKSNSEFAGFSPGTSAFERAVADWASSWAQHNQGRGLTAGKAAVLFIDEPTNSESLGAAYEYARAFKTGTSDVIVFANPDPKAVHNEAGRKVIASSDLLCLHRVKYARSGPETRKAIQDLDRPSRSLRFYNTAASRRIHDPAYYRFQPWFCFQAGASGSLFWSYGDNAGGNSWNEYSSAGDADYSPVFLSPTGIHSSKHWEATREGIQDYQYLAMLRNVVRIMERDGTTPDLQREAALMLSTTPTATIKALHKNGDRVDTDNNRNPSVFADQARLRVLRMLVKIYNAYSSTADQ